MYIVYILKSEKHPARHYVGLTDNLERRLGQHNGEQSEYSSKYAPWQVETYAAFQNKDLAAQFEKYLKSGSGHAFLKKRLIGKS